MKDDLKTFSVVSSLYISFFCVGRTIGPFIGGYAYDHIGFRWGSMIVIGLTATTVSERKCDFLCNFNGNMNLRHFF